MGLLAVIGGTGVYDPSMFDDISTLSCMTPYGEITCTKGSYKGKDVIFMPRHGANHSIPPHLINYRANIWGLKKLGVTNIISTTAVGSLNKEFGPGYFVLPDQFLDFTKNRKSTFFEGGAKGVVHVDVTDPYCKATRSILEKVGKDLGLKVHNSGTYVCTEGPRFETPAEIKMFALLGGDLVGMTNVPEVTLAREAEMCYATISMVTNYAAGISTEALTHHEVLEEMAKNSAALKEFILASIDAIYGDDHCLCHSALAEYGGFKVEA